jgi:hypothetical protein
MLITQAIWHQTFSWHHYDLFLAHCTASGLTLCLRCAAGYFDADGNYIEYKLEQLKDAWLDTLEVSKRCRARVTAFDERPRLLSDCGWLSLQG